jgi:leucyl-tRNA synthetase
MGLLDTLKSLATLSNGHFACNCSDCDAIRAASWKAMRARRVEGAPAETLGEILAESLHPNTSPILVQVNGKPVGSVRLAETATEEDARAAVAKDEAVQALTRGKTEKKFLYVPGRIIHVVVA